jgi:hypothetical protein
MSTRTPVMAGRRCGSRIAGGVYVEVPLSATGLPLENFLCDPAIRIPDELELPNRGMVLRTTEDGTNILYDLIGKDNYPNVLDFVEEVRAMGLSRRIQSNFDFSQLNGKTIYCAVHPRGYVANESWYREYARENPIAGDDGISRETPWPCPKLQHTKGSNHTEPCSAVWWHDIAPGPDVSPTGYDRIVEVAQPSAPPYRAMSRPPGILPIYYPAIVLTLPLRKLSVIRGEDGEHEKPLQNAAQAGKGIQVKLEDA